MISALAGAVRVAAMAIMLVASLVASAHKPSDSYLTLTPQQNTVNVRWDIALRDLDAELGLDVDDDGLLTWGEVRSRQRDLDAFVLPNLRVRANRTNCEVESTSAPTRLAIDSHSDGAYAVFEYQLVCPASARWLRSDPQCPPITSRGASRL